MDQANITEQECEFSAWKKRAHISARRIRIPWQRRLCTTHGVWLHREAWLCPSLWQTLQIRSYSEVLIPMSLLC